MKRILIQLDTDPHPSVFDRVVAVDAGADELFAYGGVTPENVTGLVHGAIFTRHPAELKNTAIFIGGSDVVAGEALLKKVQSLFFGPMRVSVLIDSNGSNTTAAAAVRAAAKHLDLATSDCLVLGGTGPVGHRAAQILASLGAQVRVASRQRERAEQTCQILRAAQPNAQVWPVAFPGADLKESCRGAQLLIAAGAAGVQFLAKEDWQGLPELQVAIDLNAVSPLGLAGIEITDKAKQQGRVICYGAIGVGGSKMKVHAAAVKQLFERNDQILDTASLYRIAESLG